MFISSSVLNKNLLDFFFSPDTTSRVPAPLKAALHRTPVLKNHLLYLPWGRPRQRHHHLYRTPTRNQPQFRPGTRRCLRCRRNPQHNPPLLRTSLRTLPGNPRKAPDLQPARSRRPAPLGPERGTPSSVETRGKLLQYILFPF